MEPSLPLELSTVDRRPSTELQRLVRHLERAAILGRGEPRLVRDGGQHVAGEVERGVALPA
jgi:hypothetical protein